MCEREMTRVSHPSLFLTVFVILMSSPLITSVFPEELSEDGALDIVTPRILYCLIQVKQRVYYESERE